MSILMAVTCYVSAQSVDDICAKHVENLGGSTAIANVKSLKITQIGTSQGNDIPMTTILIPGKTYYQKVRTAIGSLTTCVNGDDAWTYTTSPSPKTTSIPPIMAKSMLIDSKFYGPIYDYYINGNASDVKGISIDGHSTIDREDCFKFIITYKSGYKVTAYVSSLNYMLKKVESASGTFKYDNYKKASGVMIPRYVEMTNANGTITTVVSKVEVNCKIKNDIFTRP